MMESINMKSIFAFMLITILVGCKTINEGMDAEELADVKEAAISENVQEESASNEERHIEEVPEVLAIIEASKVAESGQDSKEPVKEKSSRKRAAKEVTQKKASVPMEIKEEIKLEESPLLEEKVSEEAVVEMDDIVEDILIENVKASEICTDWKSSRSGAKEKWLGKTIVFEGRMTSVSHTDQYSNDGNIVFLDADKLVSLGVIFNSFRETLRFTTGQNISLSGKLTEIKRANAGRCLFIVRDASVIR